MWKTFFGGFLVRLLSRGIPARIAAWKTAAQRGALVAGAGKGALKMWGSYELVDWIVQSFYDDEAPVTPRSDDEYKQLASANGDNPDADFGDQTADPYEWLDRTTKILTRRHDVADKVVAAARSMQSTVALVKAGETQAASCENNGGIMIDRQRNLIHAVSEVSQSFGVAATQIPPMVKNMRKLLGASDAELELILDFANFGGR